MRTEDNYINGKWVQPSNGSYLDVYNPATGEIMARVANSDARDVAMAVEAAKAAFPAWRAMPAEERTTLLLRIADAIEHKLDALAQLESDNNGKPLKLAKSVDIPRAVSNFRFYATAAWQFASESHNMEDHAINYTLRQPLGVVGCISPWNLPLYLFTWKIAPALATGNCVVAKPSEVTPLTAAELAHIVHECGLPAGVLNILHGTGPDCGSEIVRHPSVKAISFTGSTRAGRDIASIAAPMFKKMSLELGGKNPNLVFADCDLDQAIKTTINSSFSNQGEICLCGSRIYVERTIYDTFLERFISETKKLLVGDPLEPTTRIGAIVSKMHYDKILSYIQLAKEEGGQIVFGGNTIKLNGRCADGWFIEPTIVTGLDNLCRTQQEEVFGPFVTITPFDTEEDALSMANQSTYGLSATIWTKDLNRAHRVAANIESGIVWINCWLLRDLRTPFGGMKNSGAGREGGWEAMRFFTEPKNVCIKIY